MPWPLTEKKKSAASLPAPPMAGWFSATSRKPTLTSCVKTSPPARSVTVALYSVGSPRPLGHQASAAGRARRTARALSPGASAAAALPAPPGRPGMATSTLAGAPARRASAVTCTVTTAPHAAAPASGTGRAAGVVATAMASSAAPAEARRYSGRQMPEGLKLGAKSQPQSTPGLRT